MSVKFQDFSFEVKAKINEESIAWLYETANEITSQAQRNCSLGEEYSSQLRESYRYDVDETKGEALVGSPLEQAFWEEFGTGSYADMSKNGGRPGRQGWWVYIEGGSGYEKPTKHYSTKEDAERAAAFLRNVKKLNAQVSNGRAPNYTLEKAFTKTKPKAIAELERRMKEMG